MTKWLIYLVGLDYAFVRADRRLLNIFCGLIMLAVGLTFFGFEYAILNTTQNVFLSVLISIFFGFFFNQYISTSLFNIRR